MINFLGSLLLIVIPLRDGTLHDRVKVLEHHWFFDECGRLVFEQLIGWDDYPGEGEHVVFWRLIKSPSMLPQRDWTNGGYYVSWLDGETAWRCVRAPMTRERWTQWDVELADRDALCKERRRELRNK